VIVGLGAAEMKLSGVGCWEWGCGIRGSWFGVQG